MSTLLVNPKMDPALAARVLASVTGRRRLVVTKRSTARTVSLLRIGVALALVASVGSVLFSRQRDRMAFQRAQAALLDHWRTEAAAIAAKNQGFVGRVGALLAGEARVYSGDLIAEELRTAGALASLLGRPSVYVRGATAAFAGPDGITRPAAESGKDALLLCLLDPPASLTEKLLLPKARLALAGGLPVQELTSNVRRLADAVVGLPYLLPAWGARVLQAKDLLTVERLERELKKAPLEAAKRVLRAELLIAIYDEPNDAGGVTEMDGEHVHSVRVVLVELSSGKTLLRLRRQVDPNWVTANRRSQYARELDGCKLALEVRAAVGS